MRNESYLWQVIVAETKRGVFIYRMDANEPQDDRMAKLLRVLTNQAQQKLITISQAGAILNEFLESKRPI